MADPITAGIVISAGMGAVAAASQGVQGYQQQQAESSAAKYNAAVLQQQGLAESNVAAANEAMSTRKSAGELGKQAAAFGEANIGTGPTVQNVEKQSATNAREDALNIWYGGELERYQASNAAQEQLYRSKVASADATSALIGGGIGAGTRALMGSANIYSYKTTGQVLPQLGGNL